MPISNTKHTFDICLLDIEKRLLPYAYALKERLENNEAPTEGDLDFLLQFQKAIQNLNACAINLPDNHLVLGNLIQLYSSLVSMAADNSSIT